MSMNWSKVGEVVKVASPILGTLLGGPAGATVGTMIAAAIGSKDDPAAVAAALQTDPTAATKIAEIHANQQVELQRLLLNSQNAQFEAEVDDRKSARDLASKQPNDFIRPTVAIILLLGSAAIMFALFTGAAKEVMTNPVAATPVGIIIGYWFNELKQVLGFYFGTTKESNAQANAIAKFAVADGTVKNG